MRTPKTRHVDEFCDKYMNKFQKYYDAISFLEGMVNIPLKKEFMSDRTDRSIFLDRMNYFLKLIGNPEKDFKFVHVTGTSGKGTVSTMVYEMLCAEGKRAGLFTSPFVTTSIEKIQTLGKYIPPQDFARIVEKLKPAIDQMYIKSGYGRSSYFEIIFAIALIYFKEQKCEWVVLEVGCGGEHDATNIIKNPIATVITNIDYDHTHILGRTLNKIARTKAGIIKRGSLFFTTEQRPRIVKMLQGICSKRGAKFNHISGNSDYQVLNQNLARAVGKAIDIEDNAIEKGIRNTKLPARFEIMQKSPLVVVDGAHNASKMRSTAYNLSKLKYRKIYLVFGISDNKDSHDILPEIIPYADHIFFTRFGTPERKCAAPSRIQTESKPLMKADTKSEIFLDSSLALGRALELAKPTDLVLITGSFFLAGELRKHWINEERVLNRLSSW